MESHNLIDAHEPLTFVDDESIPARNSSVVDQNSSQLFLNKSLNRSVATMKTVELGTPSRKDRMRGQDTTSSEYYVNP